MIGLVPCEEIEEQARLVERPTAPLVALEDLSNSSLVRRRFRKCSWSGALS